MQWVIKPQQAMNIEKNTNIWMKTRICETYIWVPKLITWEFNRLHLISTRWKRWTMEEDRYTKRRRENPPNCSRCPRLHFFDP